MVLDVPEPLGMVFDVFGRGKSLLLPLPLTREYFDNFVPNWGNLGMSLLASRDLEPATLIASKITRPFEGVGLRVLYLVKRVRC